MSTTNLHSPVAVNTPAKAQNFILPKCKDSLDPLLPYLYSENYIDEPAKSTCRRCKVKRTRRVCAKGQLGKHGNPCWIAFDFCPKCLRVKADSPHQRKMMELVTGIKPLTNKYVFIQTKFQQARVEGRLVIAKSEYDQWILEFSTQALVERGCTNAN